MYSTKHHHYFIARLVPTFLLSYSGGVFYFHKNKLTFLFFLITYNTIGQFFVGTNTNVYVHEKSSLYVQTEEVYLFSKIDNNGTFVLDNTHRLTISSRQILEGITLVNQNLVTIITINKDAATIAKKPPTTVSKDDYKIFPQWYNDGNFPLPNLLFFFKTQNMVVVNTFTFKDKKKQPHATVMLLSYFKALNDAVIIENYRAFFENNVLYAIILQSDYEARPPPFTTLWV